MKLHLGTLVLAMLASASVHAATGTFVGGQLANMSATLDFSNGSATASASSDHDSQYLGVTFGYKRVEANQVGFIADLAYNFKIGGTGWADYGFLRAEGDIAYGLTDQFFILGGINLTKFVSNDDFAKYDMGVGFQVGAGFNLDNANSIELRYLQLTSKRSISGTDVTVTLKPFELAFNHSF